MTKSYNPDSIAAPLGHYNHAVEVPPGARVLHLSGQVGVKPDGSVADGAAAQAEQAWQNVAAILAEAGMGIEDLVSTTTYIIRPEDAQAIRDVRGRFLGDHRPTSTLLVIAALARPEFLFELEAIAAKA